MDIKRKFDFSGLVLGIFSIFTAYTIFDDPMAGILSLTYLIGILAIVSGVYQIWFFGQAKELTGISLNKLIISGILSITIGFIFEIRLEIVSTVMMYLFAVWFLIIGVTEISASYIHYRMNSKFYLIIVAGGFINGLIGVILMFNPWLSLMTIMFLIATNFLIYGIVKILSLY